jgi:hypothetical protein
MGIVFPMIQTHGGFPMKLLVTLACVSIATTAFGGDVDPMRVDQSDRIVPKFVAPMSQASMTAQCLTSAPLVGGITKDKETRQNSRKSVCMDTPSEAAGFGTSTDRASD